MGEKNDLVVIDRKGRIIGESKRNQHRSEFKPGSFTFTFKQLTDRKLNNLPRSEWLQGSAFMVAWEGRGATLLCGFMTILRNVISPQTFLPTPCTCRSRLSHSINL